MSCCMDVSLEGDPSDELEDDEPDELEDDGLDKLEDDPESMLEASSKLGGPLNENWTPVGRMPVCPSLSITPKAVSCKHHTPSATSLHKAHEAKVHALAASARSVWQMVSYSCLCRHDAANTLCRLLSQRSVAEAQATDGRSQLLRSREG